MCQQPLCKCSVMAFGLCVCECVCSECGRCGRMWRLVCCAIVSSTGKVPARRENNAHKRLSEEASGADVFHTALNGAAAACVRVCACSSYECKRHREGERNWEKTPSWTCFKTETGENKTSLFSRPSHVYWNVSDCMYMNPCPPKYMCGMVKSSKIAIWFGFCRS